ncbi:PIN domain-containing protein [Thiorhodovibrio winogradskyi]|nr:hypothetical protein [Thiorhodovibrio winogradskyi]
MIAAIAKVRGLRVVTRNLADFAPFGVDLLNPFEFRANTGTTGDASRGENPK